MLFGFTNTVATVGIVQMYLFLVFKGSWRYLQDSAYLFSDNSKVMRTHERHKQATAGDGFCICYVPPPALSCTTLSLYSCRSVCQYLCHSVYVCGHTHVCVHADSSVADNNNTNSPKKQLGDFNEHHAK